MKDFFRWNEGSILNYSTSIASSWIWSPAIFIAAQQAFFNGLQGFLMFFLPNLLTLILFAYVAAYACKNKEGYTVIDALAKASQRQKYVHILTYLLILMCSCCTQLIGIQMLLSWLFPYPAIIAIATSMLAIAMVWRGGIKASIITDTYKYFIMLACAIWLFCTTGDLEFTLAGANNQDFSSLFQSFGVITALGLLSGVYSDTTLWQRAFSIPKEKIKTSFILAAAMFAVIPLLFGLIGFSCGNSPEWTLMKEFPNGVGFAVLCLCVLSTLIATLDSNLCSAASVPCKVFNMDFKFGKLAMCGLTALSCVLVSLQLFDLTYIFLVYNTVRVCICTPTLLIIFGHYDGNRLFAGTMLAIAIAPLGYIVTGNYIFTVLGLLMPLVGLRLKGSGEMFKEEMSNEKEGDNVRPELVRRA